MDDGDPDSEDNGSSEDPATTSAVVPDEANSLISSVQRELTALGYYQGPIDGLPVRKRKMRFAGSRRSITFR